VSSTIRKHHGRLPDSRLGLHERNGGIARAQGGGQNLCERLADVINLASDAEAKILELEPTTPELSAQRTGATARRAPHQRSSL
jgi:hypothetical protein